MYVEVATIVATAIKTYSLSIQKLSSLESYQDPCHLRNKYAITNCHVISNRYNRHPDAYNKNNLRHEQTIVTICNTRPF